MELNQLRQFVAAAEAEHFTQAAQSLFMAQSSLSRTINHLEKELGVTLFDRVGKTVRINEFGRTVLRYSKEIFDLVEELEKTIDDMQDGTRGSVSVGYGISSNAPIWLDETIRTYVNCHPNVRLTLSQMAPNELVNALEERVIDVALNSFVALEPSPHIVWRPMFVETMGVLLSVDHRLAEKKSLSLEELKGERFLINNSNSDNEYLTRSLCAQGGYEPDFFWRMDRPELIGEMIAQKMGVAFISYEGFEVVKSKKPYYVPSEDLLVFRPISDANCSKICSVGYVNRVQTKAVRDFVDTLFQVVKERHPSGLVGEAKEA